MTEQPPWWAIPLLSGFLALAGVFVGQVLTIWSEKRRTKREDQQRWHQQRLDLYFDYHETAWQVRDAIHNFRLGEGESLSIEDIHSTHRLLNRIGLISTPTVHDAALDVFSHLFISLLETMKTYTEWADGSDPQGDATDDSPESEAGPAWNDDDLENEIGRSFVSFSAAVRAELGVPLPWLSTEPHGAKHLRHWMERRRAKQRHPSRAKRH